MGVKVILLRRVPVEKESFLRPLLLKLRSLAMTQPGYVSGETLMNADDPEEFLVISSWRSVEDWNNWLGSEQRAGLQKEVDDLLGQDTYYQVYYNG